MRILLLPLVYRSKILWIWMDLAMPFHDLSWIHWFHSPTGYVCVCVCVCLVPYMCHRFLLERKPIWRFGSPITEAATDSILWLGNVCGCSMTSPKVRICLGLGSHSSILTRPGHHIRPALLQQPFESTIWGNPSFLSGRTRQLRNNRIHAWGSRL